MQTPALPASSASSARNSAENFFSDKPSDAREQFGDVMNRALHSGTGILPVRPRSQGPNPHSTIDHEITEHDTGKKSASVKPKKPLHRASDNQKITEATAPANALITALVAPITPNPAPSLTPPIDPSDTSDTDHPMAPIAADATNTVVANANPSETKADNSTAKPIPAGLETQQASETTSSIEHPPKPPAADIAPLLAKQSTEAAADPAEPAQSSDSDPSLAQIAGPKNANETMSAGSPDPHGTSAAKQDVTMKKAEKTQKVAGSAEQDLPGNAAKGSEELPKGQKSSEKAASHGEKMDSTIELPTRVSTSVNSPSATITSAAPAASTSLDSRVLERTHDIVALHAMRLTDTGVDTLHVVVKPGAGVQISLELRQSARGIEVSASLHKGDYDQLSQHWPDLQQRLEARGVRVGSLTPSENYTGTGRHFHQSKKQSSQQESLQAGAFAEFALAGSMTEAPGTRAARASAHRGWETWA